MRIINDIFILYSRNNHSEQNIKTNGDNRSLLSNTNIDEMNVHSTASHSGEVNIMSIASDTQNSSTLIESQCKVISNMQLLDTLI